MKRFLSNHIWGIIEGTLIGSTATLGADIIIMFFGKQFANSINVSYEAYITDSNIVAAVTFVASLTTFILYRIGFRNWKYSQ